MRSLWPAVAGAALAVISGCADSPGSTRVTAGSLDVRWSGCSETWRGPVCHVSPGAEMTLWIPRGASCADPLRAAVEGARVEDRRHLAGGAQLVVTAEGDQLAVTCGGRWELALGRVPPRTWKHEADRLRFAGDLEAAEQAVKDRGPGHWSGVLVARGLLARLALARGQFERAAAELTRSGEGALSAGFISQGVHDLFAAAWVTREHLGDLAEAHRLLDVAESQVPSYPDALSSVLMYRAQTARMQGDFRRALAALREGADRADRLRSPLRDTITETLAVLLADIGRQAEGRHLLDQLVEAADEPGADLLLNAAWIGTLEVAAGDHQHLEETLAHLRRALPLYEARDGQAIWAHHARLSLAYLYMEANRPGEAAPHLDAVLADPGGLDVRTRLWAEVLSGRFALSTSDGPGAVELLERARAAAERAARPELVREALTWLGVAHQALGEHAAATSAWLAAERIVDAASLNVPLGEGRGGFVGGTRGDATQRLVSHLLRVGDAEQAFAAARRGRRRALAGVTMQAVLASATPGQRQAWGAFLAEYRGERAELDAALAESWSWEQAEEEVRLQQLSVRRAALEGRFERSLSELGVDASAPSDETDVRPERGTLWLLWAPSADGWVGFAATDDGVTVLDLGPRLDDLGAWLLAPFDDAIEACEQVNVLLPAELSTVPVHGLSWRGAPLYEHRAVAYRVDAAPAAPASEPTHALVVSDADGNLPGSRAEGELVGAALQAQSLTVEARVGPGAVDPARLSELLSSTDHLHFAGHAVAEGPDGWESGLLLGRAVVGRRLVWSRFAPADVLALPAVPGSVVLSACSSGARVSGDAVGLGLARAFVLAGSRWAVGTTREVGDVEARAVAEAFYAEGLPASNAEAAGRLRAALRSVPQVADDYRLYIQ